LNSFRKQIGRTELPRSSCVISWTKLRNIQWKVPSVSK